MSQTVRDARQIIGREREQATLRALALAAHNGAGALVLLGGEAGIGKTALVEALGREASAAGLAALTGHCYDLSATPPYGPWLDTGLFTPVADDRRLTPERQRILDLLRRRGSVRPADLAAALDLTTANAAQALHRLQKLGLVSKTGYGTYERARAAGVTPSQSSQGLPAGSGIAVPPLQALSRGEESAARGHAALFEEIRDYLGAVAARQPLVIILEDLHWADPISLELLRFIARQLAALPVLLVVTYRDDALTRRHPLYQLLPLLVREAGARRLDLRPLDEAALRALTATRYDLPPDATARLLAYLARRAGGNPLFALELLHALEEEVILRREGAQWHLGDLDNLRVPRPLREVIDGRLLRLGEEARDLLAIAATIGQTVPLGLWQAVSGAPDERLAAVVEAASAARILDDATDGAHLHFHHALIREALYHELALPRRRVWHRRIGEELSAAPEASPADVAYHFRQAGDRRAAAWLVRAGERAERAHATVTAAEQFAAAAELLGGEATAARERGWLLLRAGSLLCYSQIAQSKALLERAEEVAESLDDQELAINSRFSRGIVHCIHGSMGRGLDAMAAATAAADALARDDDSWPGKLAARYVAERAGNAERDTWPREHAAALRRINLTENYFVEWLAHAGRYREAVARGERYFARLAAALAGAQPPLTVCGNAHFGLGVAYAALGDLAGARTAFARARQAFADADQRVLVSFVEVNELLLLALPYWPERRDERHRLAGAESAAQASAAGAFSGDRPLAIGAQWLHLLEGRWDEAAALTTPDRSAFESGALRQYAVCTLAELARRRGDREAAWRWIREVLPLGAATEPGDHRFFSAVYTQRVAAALALDAGDLTQAESWLRSHDRWLTWSDATLGRAEGQLLWARYHRARGDNAEARASAHAARALADTPPQPLAILACERFLAELATADRDSAAAHDHLDAAFALADACGAPYERLLTLVAATETQLVMPGSLPGHPYLDEARTVATTLDARPILDHLDALAQQADGGEAARAPAALLSRREVAVLRLAADGLTDRQIAEHLAISPRTVGQHLSSLYTKLDVPSRAAAVRRAIERGLL